MKVIHVRFYRTLSGKEPVKDWLLGLVREDRQTIGADIKTVEFGWPLGMPLVRKLDKNLWEVRSNISDNRIARVLFTIEDQEMILLHGFIKKAQKPPKPDLELAKKRCNNVLN